jgi:DNA-binding CsgD family transcriptional regulator
MKRFFMKPTIKRRVPRFPSGVYESNYITYCPVISAILISANETPVKKGKKITLSQQQLKVFLLMLENLPNKLIADKLDLTPETVRSYRKEVLKKIRNSGYSFNLEYAVAM